MMRPWKLVTKATARECAITFLVQSLNMYFDATGDLRPHKVLYGIRAFPGSWCGMC